MNTQTQEALKMAIEYFEANFQGLNPINSNEQIIQACKEALAELQAHDEEIIERCAKVCEKVDETTTECPELAIYCAEAIRALKGKES